MMTLHRNELIIHKGKGVGFMVGYKDMHGIIKLMQWYKFLLYLNLWIFVPVINELKDKLYLSFLLRLQSHNLKPWIQLGYAGQVI